MKPNGTTSSRVRWTDEQMSAELNTYEALDTFSVTLDYQDAEMQGAFRVMHEM